jgi:ABC-type multidrug transport system fused ATPase/permease subunit
VHITIALIGEILLLLCCVFLAWLRVMLLSAPSCSVCLLISNLLYSWYFLQVIELIKRTPKEAPTGDFVPDSGTLQGALALDNVVFSYPIRPTQRVLNGLSMTVNPGMYQLLL